jgi:hypothetical protein
MRSESLTATQGKDSTGTLNLSMLWGISSDRRFSIEHAESHSSHRGCGDARGSRP